MSKGLTKENKKKLTSWKGTWQDWVVFFMIVMVLAMAWAYQHDIGVCFEQLDYIKEEVSTGGRLECEGKDCTLIPADVAHLDWGWENTAINITTNAS